MHCPICRQECANFHSHHVWAQAHGGSQGATLDICATCHDALHRQTAHWLAGKQEKLYFTPDVLPRALPLIQTLMLAAQTARDRPGFAENKYLRIRLHDPDLLGKLHRLKVQRGFRSLEALLNAILQAVTKF